MYETYISFYLSTGRVHIRSEALRQIGEPQFVRFLLSNDGRSMIMEPYHKKVFVSMRVPAGVYGKGEKRRKMEPRCMPLCRLLADHLGWGEGASYRIPGRVLPQQGIAKFDLTKAVPIKGEDE